MMSSAKIRTRPLSTRSMGAYDRGMTAFGSINEVRRAARRRLPRFLFDYLDGGAGAEGAMRRNRADLEDICLDQRVLHGCASVDTRTRLFGREQALPVVLGPLGLAGMSARRGEAAAARAAERNGVPICLSTMSVCSLEEVRAGFSGDLWFQLYVMRDRAFLAAAMDRAAAAGCDVLVLTVDMPAPGNRLRDRRSGLTGPGSAWRRLTQAVCHPNWAWDVGLRGRPHALGNLAESLDAKPGLGGYMAWIGANFDPSIDWNDLVALRDRWRGRLVLKGIMTVADAERAVALGADGIVVSNHGGRQLEAAPSTAMALPAIAAAVRDRTTVLVDGGLRSGLDVARMLALGAHGVLLGRAWGYGLAAGGEAGVDEVLRLIAADLALVMMLTGTASVDAFGQQSVASGERTIVR